MRPIFDDRGGVMPPPRSIRVTAVPDGLGWYVRHENGVMLGEALVDVDGECYFWFDRSRSGGWSARVLGEISAFLREMSIEIEPAPPAGVVSPDRTLTAPWE